MKPLAIATLAAVALAAAACAGPVTPSPVEGEPVCADFEIGATHARMRGSLRYPVQVTILEGEKILSKAILYGLREPGAQASRVLVPDDNGEYRVQWAQCENERAPRPVSKTKDTSEVAQYECGKATEYKTDTITTKRGDPASRKLTFAMPPKAECWVAEAPAAVEAADAGVDAGADAAAGADTAAGADAGTDAGTGADAGADTDAGADAGADAAAGATADAGTGDAGTKKDKKPATTKKAAPPAQEGSSPY